MSQPEKPVCEVCVRIRWFLAIAIPLVVLMGTQTETSFNIPLHEIAAEGIFVALIVILGWRIYEYRQDKKAIARLMARR
ncbi:MAG: hypothetical protein GWP70_13055, partial [Proteobacteria bacterium]|nr:hypothetical protein [Pseudomonadota bacterium]